MYCGGRHKQPCSGKGKDIFFTFRQRGKVGLCKLHSGDNGVVVGYLFTVQHPCKLRRKVYALHKRKLPAKQRDNARRRIAHVVGQKCVVRSRIGQELLFIQGLCKVKGLFCRISEQAVCFPL